MQLPLRSQVSHRKYYKLTQNLINQGRTTWGAPVGAALHESGFEPVGAHERSYRSAA